ncbi:hypothetical protein BQ8482_180336 [Mesorhizobium delmotii]|uniref:Uncharacterized protein n=1 Tax=Mesorhizobium delmotii TaxID=1631247 RepID=A0A2P9AJ02_9HYPH|nr:hypothetical protein BQ8482_180336 [Mesorhizobium delmotii]
MIPKSGIRFSEKDHDQTMRQSLIGIRLGDRDLVDGRDNSRRVRRRAAKQTRAHDCRRPCHRSDLGLHHRQRAFA